MKPTHHCSPRWLGGDVTVLGVRPLAANVDGMRSRIRWALIKTVWLTASCAFLMGAYAKVTPRFY